MMDEKQETEAALRELACATNIRWVRSNAAEFSIQCGDAVEHWMVECKLPQGYGLSPLSQRDVESVFESIHIGLVRKSKLYREWMHQQVAAKLLLIQTMEQHQYGLKDKQYWETVYHVELGNFQDNGDVGEVWFESSVGTLHKWILDSVTWIQWHQAAVLDVGSGNGVWLFDLAEILLEKGQFTGKLIGVDYVDTAVELAMQVLEEEHQEFKDTVQFACGDALKLDTMFSEKSFDIVHDKGTFDVISLRGEDEISKYLHQIQTLLKPEGCFCITSCNHTSGELEEWIRRYSPNLSTFKIRPYPVIQFGGVSGSKVSTVLFKL